MAGSAHGAGGVGGIRHRVVADAVVLAGGARGRRAAAGLPGSGGPRPAPGLRLAGPGPARGDVRAGGGPGGADHRARAPASGAVRRRASRRARGAHRAVAGAQPHRAGTARLDRARPDGGRRAGGRGTRRERLRVHGPGPGRHRGDRPGRAGGSGTGAGHPAGVGAPREQPAHAHRRRPAAGVGPRLRGEGGSRTDRPAGRRAGAGVQRGLPHPPGVPDQRAAARGRRARAGPHRGHRRRPRPGGAQPAHRRDTGSRSGQRAARDTRTCGPARRAGTDRALSLIQLR